MLFTIQKDNKHGSFDDTYVRTGLMYVSLEKLHHFMKYNITNISDIDIPSGAELNSSVDESSEYRTYTSEMTIKSHYKPVEHPLFDLKKCMNILQYTLVEAVLWYVDILEGCKSDTNKELQKSLQTQILKITDDLKEIVLRNPYSVKYIGQSEDVGIDNAINRDPHVLKYVKNQTLKVCVAALKKDSGVFYYIRCPELREHLLKCMPLILCPKQTEEISKNAIIFYPLSIEYVLDQTPKLCELAVDLDSNTISVIRHQTEKLCEKAVKLLPSSIVHVRKQTKELIDLSRKLNYSDGLSLYFDKNNNTYPWSTN